MPRRPDMQGVPGTLIYVSNVWNHAMELVDQNSNMTKWTFYY